MVRIASLVCLVLVVASCKKPEPTPAPVDAGKPDAGRAAGVPCRKGWFVCLDDRTELACPDGLAHLYPCKGPNGCTMQGEGHVACDVSVSDVGDACREKTAACTADKKTLLSCQNGKFDAEYTCTGPKGCSERACDDPRAASGKPCAGEGADVCSPDGREVVTCQGGRFVTRRVCRGKDGKCASGVCTDPYTAEAGDACAGEQAGCSPDGHAYLACKDGKMTMAHACTTCRGGDPTPGQIGCRF